MVNVDISLVYHPWYIQLNSFTSPVFEGDSFQNCKVSRNHSAIKKTFPGPKIHNQHVPFCSIFCHCVDCCQGPHLFFPPENLRLCYGHIHRQMVGLLSAASWEQAVNLGT